VASLMVRLPREELVGQLLSLIGAALYFGVPVMLAWTVDTRGLSGNAVFLSIVRSMRTAGAIALLPGLTLILRDAILRIWTGVSVKRVLERRWGDEEEQRKKRRVPKVLASCWDMSFCRGFVRQVCPAFAANKSCWRLKVGCYCDENTILKAMTAGGKDNTYAQGIMKSLELDKPSNKRLSARLRRERCRRCLIYAEHQRQKYRLLSPMVFPAVFVVLYIFYSPVTTWVGAALEKADRFMSFLTYHPKGASYTFSDDGRVLTILAVIWLTIIVISYALRVLEYLVFEMQV